MKLIFISGIVLVIGSILLIICNYDNLDVEKKGTIVKMRIEQLPESCLGTKIKHFVKLSYKGETYTKRIGGKFCDDHSVGQQVEVRFLEGASIVLFPDETATSNLIAFVVLGLIGIAMVLWQWKKNRK